MHTICLSNEPVNEEEPCEAAQRQWRAWLEKRHGNVTSLSSLCGSNFASLAAVPLPNPFGPRPACALWMDYIRFNQEFFADWHQRMADAIHAVAPGLPVHAKAMTWTMVNDGDSEFAQGWQLNAMTHDLQRSVLDAPVFNTENHLITDRDTRTVRPHISAPR